MAATGERFTINTNLRYRARVGVPRVGIASCGFGTEAMRRATLSLTTNLYWRRDWKIGSRETAFAASLVDQCRVTALNIDATGALRLRDRRTVEALRRAGGFGASDRRRSAPAGRLALARVPGTAADGHAQFALARARSRGDSRESTGGRGTEFQDGHRDLRASPCDCRCEAADARQAAPGPDARHQPRRVRGAGAGGAAVRGGEPPLHRAPRPGNRPTRTSGWTACTCRRTATACGSPST